MWWELAPHLGRLSPPLVKGQRRPSNAKPRGPQSQSGCFTEDKNLLPLPWIKLQYLGCPLLRAWFHYIAQHIYKRQKLCSTRRRVFQHTNIRAAEFAVATNIIDTIRYATCCDRLMLVVPGCLTQTGVPARSMSPAIVDEPLIDVQSVKLATSSTAVFACYTNPLTQD